MVVPRKSSNDRKDYRVITLKNGLKTLLISEPHDEDSVDDNVSSSESEDGSEEDEAMESDFSDDGDDQNKATSTKIDEKLAAAAICIGIGNFSDPADIGGLAHYLEHMVFMGSEKYPDENKFDSFTQNHGGGNNASTDVERTIFQFDVTQKYFRETLDIFAQFFISPLMKKDSMDRELQAVESEYQMNLPNDYFRKQHIFSTMAKKGHPMGGFMWGNVLSLKTMPEKENIDIYKNLQEFRKKYYSAHYMTLVVQARESLDTLQEWVEEIFCKVPNNGSPKPVFKDFQDSFKTPQFHKFYRVVPVKSTHRVILNWVLPSCVDHYREKPLDYVGWLVGHEGRGSILSYLRKKVWALGIYGGNDGSGFEHNSTCSLFSITIELTDEGLDNLFEVITVVLEYLEMLRKIGASERIFKEIQTIEDNNFMWKEEESPIEYVENLSEGMQLYSVEDYLTGDSLFMEFNPKLIEQCQDALVPNEMNVIVFSPRYEAESSNFLKEFWSNAPYDVSDINPDWMKAWKELVPRCELHLPQQNKFIANDFTMTEKELTDSQYPVSIVNDDVSELWFKRDSKFNIPKVHVYYQLQSSVSYTSAQNAMMMDMLVNIMDQNLKDEAYDADVAELTYNILNNESGLIIKAYGFNDKLPILFFTIIDYLDGFQVSDELFDGIKTQLIKIYYNNYIKPKFLCRDVRLSILQNVYWNSVDKRTAAASVTQPMIMEFVNQFKSTLRLKGLIQGNISHKDAIEMHDKLKMKLKLKKSSAVSPKVQVMKLPKKSQMCRVMNFNCDDANSVITNYYQFGPADITDNTMMELFVMFLEEPSFDILRTKEQLSYHVSCTTRDTFGIVGLTILICPQADKFSCKYVEERIEVFLDEFMNIMSKLSEEDFQVQVQSLIKLRQCADLYLKEEVDRNWAEIDASYYIFDRREREIEILRSITLSELQTWCQKQLSASGELRQKKLTVQVIGKGKEEPENSAVFSKNESTHTLQHILSSSNEGYLEVTDIPTTKKMMELYPVSKII